MNRRYRCARIPASASGARFKWLATAAADPSNDPRAGEKAEAACRASAGEGLKVSLRVDSCSAFGARYTSGAPRLIASSSRNEVATAAAHASDDAGSGEMAEAGGRASACEGPAISFRPDLGARFPCRAARLTDAGSRSETETAAAHASGDPGSGEAAEAGCRESAWNFTVGFGREIHIARAPFDRFAHLRVEIGRRQFEFTSDRRQTDVPIDALHQPNGAFGCGFCVIWQAQHGMASSQQSGREQGRDERNGMRYPIGPGYSVIGFQTVKECGRWSCMSIRRFSRDSRYKSPRQGPRLSLCCVRAPVLSSAGTKGRRAHGAGTNQLADQEAANFASLRRRPAFRWRGG